jgi:3-oxoacyl-[acyl-carrier-protein] synthase-3
VTALRSVVLGCGSYLPRQILTNAELAARIDTSDEWIVQRTGIRQRHIAAEGEFTSHLAINAARAALAHAGVDAQSIDLIVLATSTPDNTFPATAVAVQNGLGIVNGAACRRCARVSCLRSPPPIISCARVHSSARW